MSDSTTPAPGLFVLGMHRSGTSCLTGMLEAAGFNVGDVDRWNPDNPKGNREHHAVTPLNEGLLNAAGGAWDDPPNAIEVDRHQRSRMEAIVTALESEARPWLIKDPRILLLPEPWLTLRRDARRLGIFRHPLAVARSLERRNGIATEAGVRLWCRYNRGLLALLEADAFPLLLFTDDPERLEATVAEILDEDFGASVIDGELAPDRLGDFFDATLVHHAPPLGRDLEPELLATGVDGETAATAADLWRALVDHQSPRPLALDDMAGRESVDSTQERDRERGTVQETTAARDFDQLDDPEALDAAIAASVDPVPLLRAGIARLANADDPDGLVAWLGRWQARRPEDPFIAWELAKAEWAGGDRDAAIRHAQTASRLAPSWSEPPTRLAEWAFESGRWEEAAQRYRGLYAAQRAVQRPPDPAAQLFFDHGEGFCAKASVTHPLEIGAADDASRGQGRPESHPAAEGHGEHSAGEGQPVTFRIDPGSLGQAVRRIRLDPANRPVIVSGVEVTLLLADGRREKIAVSGDNALFQHDGRLHFETDDPQLICDLGALGPVDLQYIEVSFHVLQHGEAVRAANFSALLALARQLDTAGRLREAQGDLRVRRAALEDSLTVVRESLSGKLGAGLARVLMAPLTLGQGKTALDVLEDRWRALDDALQSLADPESESESRGDWDRD